MAARAVFANKVLVATCTCRSNDSNGRLPAVSSKDQMHHFCQLVK